MREPDGRQAEERHPARRRSRWATFVPYAVGVVVLISIPFLGGVLPAKGKGIWFLLLVGVAFYVMRGSANRRFRDTFERREGDPGHLGPRGPVPAEDGTAGDGVSDNGAFGHDVPGNGTAERGPR